MLMGLCNCRTCLPACCTCIFFLISVVFSIIAIIVLILGFIFTDFCGEIDRQFANESGILQWYVVPYMENQVNFTSLKQNVLQVEHDFAIQFCQQLAQHCDNNATYSLATNQSLFYCNMTNATLDCTTFPDASLIVNGSFAKFGSGVCGATNCTMRQCPSDCTDASLASGISTALSFLDLAGKAVDAFAIVEPLLDTNVLIDKVLLTFSSCHQMRDGLNEIGSAFLLTVFTLYVGQIVLLLGAKLWFSEEEMNEEPVATEMDVIEKKY